MKTDRTTLLVSGALVVLMCCTVLGQNSTNNPPGTTTNSPPYVQMVKPSTGMEFPAPANIGLVAGAVDYNGFVARVEFLQGTNVIGLGAIMQPPGTNDPAMGNAGYPPGLVYYHFMWMNVGPGQYQVRARAFDNVGSVSHSQPITFSVNTNPPRNVVRIFATDAQAAEPGDNVGVLAIQRDGPTNLALVVNLRVGGSASNGVDYVPLPGSITIPAGSTRVDLVVKPLNDQLPEYPESVSVTVLPPACIQVFPPPPDCYVVGQPSVATVTIIDDDTNFPPAVSISSPPNNSRYPTNVNILLVANAQDRDDGVASVSFLANGSLLGTVLASNYPTATDPNSGAGIYYNPFRLVWSNVPAGDYVLTARALDTRGAAAVSPPVRVFVGANTNTPPPITNKTVVTIFAPDPRAVEGTNSPILITSQSTPNAPGGVYTNWYVFSNGVDAAAFQIRRSGNLTQNLVVHYEVLGTASNGVDYAFLPGSLSFTAGVSSIKIPVVPLDDSLVEPVETVILRLRTNSAYVVGLPGTAAAYILDNDRLPPPRILPGGVFNYTLLETNLTCVRVEASDNLIDWVILGTNSPNTGLHVTDPDQAQVRKRFYRCTPVDCGPEN